MKIRVKELVQETRASFTLESTVIIPFLFIVILCLVFTAVYCYQQAIHYYASATAADRTAYVWDNSHKDPISGAFEPGHYDDLYWRLTQNNLSDIFAFWSKQDSAVLKLPEERASYYLKGPKKKLQRAAGQLSANTEGSFSFSHHLLQQSIQVKLTKGLNPPPFTNAFLSNELSVAASSQIVDPVEFIRMLRLLQNYVQELQQRGVGQEEAQAAFAQFLELHTPHHFATHREAHAYLKQLVNGRETQFDTSYGVRMVDALDPQSVSHQAFLTFNEKNLRLQLAKDAELLAAGKNVKGIVWHFFRRTNQTGKVGPSAQLLQDIERKGIVVVIHD